MSDSILNQWPKVLLGSKHSISDWVEAFILDRQIFASSGTLYYYRYKLAKFTQFCEAEGITALEDLTPGLMRLFLLQLEMQGHNPGGRHAFYRVAKTFIRWWRLETDRDREPYLFARVKAPKIPQVLQDPLRPEEIAALERACDTKTWLGLRDRAMILFLFDTGCRANEALSIELGDLDPITFAAKVFGKGNKEREVIVGVRTRRAMRAYLRRRDDECLALWVNRRGNPLQYQGLRQMLRNLAIKAGIPKAAAHMFRRSHALSLADQQLDDFALQEDLGHASIETTRRYIKRSRQALNSMRVKLSPVDNAKKG